MWNSIRILTRMTRLIMTIVFMLVVVVFRDVMMVEMVVVVFVVVVDRHLLHAVVVNCVYFKRHVNDVMPAEITILSLIFNYVLCNFKRIINRTSSLRALLLKRCFLIQTENWEPVLVSNLFKLHV